MGGSRPRAGSARLVPALQTEPKRPGENRLPGRLRGQRRRRLPTGPETKDPASGLGSPGGPKGPHCSLHRPAHPAQRSPGGRPRWVSTPAQPAAAYGWTNPWAVWAGPPGPGESACFPRRAALLSCCAWTPPAPAMTFRTDEANTAWVLAGCGRQSGPARRPGGAGREAVRCCSAARRPWGGLRGTGGRGKVGFSSFLSLSLPHLSPHKGLHR